MKYESTSENMMIIPKQVAQPTTDDILQKNLQIRTIKRKILVFVSIELIVMVIYFILQICHYFFHDSQNDNNKEVLIESFITLISIVYLITFTIVLTQYFPFGILIFVWLTLIQLLGGSVLLPLGIMSFVGSLSVIHAVGAGILVDMIYILISISIIVLSVFIILYSLNLMKLIKN